MMIIVVMLMINDDNSNGRGGQWGDLNEAKLTGSRREDGEKALTGGVREEARKREYPQPNHHIPNVLIN
jgi:hypothetical protein